MIVRDDQVVPVGVIVECQLLSDSVQYLPPYWPQAAWMQQIAGYRLKCQAGAMQPVEEGSLSNGASSARHFRMHPECLRWQLRHRLFLP